MTALGDIKKAGLMAATGEEGAVNYLEKTFWENYVPGSGGGSGPLQVPKRYVFADTGARDTYFGSKLGDLVKGETVIVAGNKVQMWSGETKPSSYVPSRWSAVTVALKGDKGDKGAAGAGIDASALSQNEVPAWDAAKQTFVPSGVKATDGEVTVSPDSIVFGGHKMSSSVENVIFENTGTNKHYVPVWQEYDQGQTNRAFLREHATAEEIVRVPQGGTRVTNPVNTGVTIDADETFFGGKFWLAQAATNVEMKIVDTQGAEVWRDKLGDLGNGVQSVTFDTPIDLKKGYQYSISMYSSDGSPVIALSNAATGFSWSVIRAKWTDKPLTSIDDLDNTITNLSVLGNVLTMTHYDGAKHAITLPAGGQVDPKTVVQVAKSGGSFVFTHEDGSTTTLRDNTGASSATVRALQTDVAAIKTDNQLIHQDITTIQQTDTALTARIAALEGKPVTPAKVTPSFYGTFGTTWPTTVSGATPSVGKRVTVSKTDGTPKRVFIMVPIAHASAVTGIKQGDGLPALWSSSDMDIDGERYKVFYSPRSLAEQSATFTVEFSQGSRYV